MSLEEVSGALEDHSAKGLVAGVGAAGQSGLDGLLGGGGRALGGRGAHEGDSLEDAEVVHAGGAVDGGGQFHLEARAEVHVGLVVAVIPKAVDEAHGVTLWHAGGHGGRDHAAKNKKQSHGAVTGLEEL